MVDAARFMLFMVWKRAKFDRSLQERDSGMLTRLICWFAPCANKAGWIDSFGSFRGGQIHLSLSLFLSENPGNETEDKYVEGFELGK